MERRAGIAVVCLLALLASRSPLPAQDFLVADEREWLASNRTSIVVARDPKWPPKDVTAPADPYNGISGDFVKRLEQLLGVTFVSLDVPDAAALRDALGQGRIDVHPALRKTPETSDRWLFTEPYIQIPMVIMVNKSFEGSLNVDDMADLRIAAGQRYGIREFVSASLPDVALVSVKSDMYGLLDLSIGELDVMILDLAAASYYMEREGLTNLRIAGRVGPFYDFRIASRRDKPMLHAILAKALAQIDRGEREAIYDRWIRFEPEPFYRSRVFWYSVGAAVLGLAFVLGLILAWNKTLKRQVAQTTRELRAAHDELEVRVQERTQELAKANEALHREMTEREQMELEMREISNRERTRIGRDLHDSLGQELAGAACLCRALARILDGEAPDRAGQADKIATLVEESVTHTKNIVRGLMPVDVEVEGLSSALRGLAAETQLTHGLRCTFECEESAAVHDNEVATNLYRITQEAVNNAARHSGAERIDIVLTVQDGAGALLIRDDGKGFDPESGDGGMGLRNMRYRAELIRGELVIESDPGTGTTVTCPFTDGRGDSSMWDQIDLPGTEPPA